MSVKEISIYEKGRYTDAEVEYKKALEKNPKSKEAQFNLGNSYYKQQRFDEALREYGNTGAAVKSPEERAVAYYNVGNSLYSSNKFREAVEAYKQSLKLNPNDDDTRYNLQMARDKTETAGTAKTAEAGSKTGPAARSEKRSAKTESAAESTTAAKARAAETGTASSAQKKNQMPKQEADRILEALRNNEKEIQKNLRKREAVKVKVEKDW